MFGKRLRHMRKALGMTQQEMSDLIGVALRSYQCYEGGSRHPSFDTLIKIGDVLSVSIDYLLGRDGFLRPNEVPFDE